MEHDRITLDTHILIWYIHEESNVRLSQRALTAIMEAEENGRIYVPAVVLIEILSLLEKRRYPISFDDMLQDIEDNEAYTIVPLTTEIIKVMRNLKYLELHDRAIVATAVMTDTDLVSIDANISRRYNRVLR
ncbi:type II toxin-antitoxin system VapC family toxin [Candidatus Poribacteria bacterium]